MFKTLTEVYMFVFKEVFQFVLIVVATERIIKEVGVDLAIIFWVFAVISWGYLKLTTPPKTSD